MNIAEILKDKPKGTKLYSTPWGKCTLEEVDTFLHLPDIKPFTRRQTRSSTFCIILLLFIYITHL